ncbi:MAG: hypothetical protein ABSG14_08990 [Verrucomicrobiia bacterium]|jgi:hypothetical protein
MRMGVPIAVLLLIFSAVSYSADDKPKSGAVGGKVYAIFLGTRSSYALEGVEAVDFNGVKCLKGRHVDMTWAAGKTCYIPVDRIDSIVEYESFDQYKQNLHEYQENRLK